LVVQTDEGTKRICKNKPVLAFIFFLFFNGGNSSFVCITSPTGVTLVFFGLKTVGEEEEKNTQVKF